MAHEEKTWHPEFIKYMDKIIHHPSYTGLTIDKKSDGSYRWLAPADSETGRKRIEWAQKKAKELNIPEHAGVYADVMLRVHPTKRKVCQICGQEMSLYYHYPNAIFLKGLNKKFNTDFTTCDHIGEIWDELIEQGYSPETVGEFLIVKGDLKLDPKVATKVEIIDSLEYACRKLNKTCLGPGAMSNFPDRFDGFHSYNRCCRSKHDKGRSKENLKSYTRDRRAYEYWSDGNIHAANEFMGSTFFNGVSADHIGPISLGFVHDPRFLQPMRSGDNSAKRDRLQLEDIKKIIETERRTGVYPMSWYSKEIWEFIRAHYTNNLDKIATVYRDALKQNMADFMHILFVILEQCDSAGREMLSKLFLGPHLEDFKYTYTFNEKGEIVNQTPRHITERSAHEFERYQRVAFDAIRDYETKTNRNISPDLTKTEALTLKRICCDINNHVGATEIRQKLENLLQDIEARLIKSIS